MTDVKEDLERKAFEEWYCSKTSESIGMNRYPNGRFRNPETENMYLAWRAAKSHAEEYGWISVEDRLPENGTMVLMCGKYKEQDVISFAAVGYLSEYGWSEHLGEGICGMADITHWMPLPNPPRVV